MCADTTPDLLTLDAAHEVARIAAVLRTQVCDLLHRKGVVVGLSGGVDSAITAALAVRALGKDRVFGVLMPEVESSVESLELGRVVADWLRLATAVEDIGPALKALGCYQRRDDAIRAVVPEFGPGWKSKLVIADAVESRIALWSIVVQSPAGGERKVRLTAASYSQIVAASSFKQRVRKMVEYYHADRLQFAVAGTPNRLEYDQGFFVKAGDGSADVKPIAHLYKSQVYQLAAYLQVPADILRRPPTTDTFPLPQTQEEFYFSIPLGKFDLCLYGKNHGLPAAYIAGAAGMTPQQVESVYASIERKRRATRYLQMHPLTIDDIDEVSHTPGSAQNQEA